MAVCDAGTAGFEYLLDFEFIKALTCTYANVAGLLVTGTLIYGSISLGIYIRTGSVIIPFVLLLTIGGAVLTQVSGIVTVFATLILLLTGAGALTYVYMRYAR